ncbi:alpha/beta hydrolase family protein [Streptomyces sp. NBC_00669]|uniref:alpha/beta hydrolase n=1 Tax=Streptomyces sp. NBC_00669 TaxID=2976011 RepID=UPI002E35E668|nr:alpha/beta hydrolase [Streptomyces sp. NBC_00669]
MTKIAAVDVAVLAQAIQQMDTGAQALSTNCASLSSQFGKYGLDTENLRKLSAIASWTRDQLPDLRRRHALAVHIGAGGDHVQVPEPISVAAADAYLFQQATKDHDSAGLALVKSDLSKNLNDPAFLKAYADASPDDITAFQGLPATDADKLNRLRLAECLKATDCPDSLKKLSAYLAQPKFKDNGVYLLGFDAKGNGHVSVSFGNPDTAANTAVYVPGTGADLDSAKGDMDRAMTLYTSANEQKPGSTASVFWLGYDAPSFSELPGGPTVQSFANDGAPKLTAFVKSLQSDHTGRGHLTVIGHSYGSTLVGDACAHFGMRPNDVVFVGSPGVTAGKASQLGIGSDHVWASKKKFDPIPQIGAPLDPLHWVDDHSDRFGNDPTSTEFGGKTFDSGSGSGVKHAHSEYWDAGPSLDNMTDIVTGQTDKVSKMPTEDKTGPLPNFADVVADPVAGIQELAGAGLQNAGHAVGGYWGRPLEDTGDALHDVGQAQNDLIGSATDLISGDPGGTLDDLKDTGSSLVDGGKNVVHTVTDFL